MLRISVKVSTKFTSQLMSDTTMMAQVSIEINCNIFLKFYTVKLFETSHTALDVTDKII